MSVPRYACGDGSRLRASNNNNASNNGANNVPLVGWVVGGDGGARLRTAMDHGLPI